MMEIRNADLEDPVYLLTLVYLMMTMSQKE